MDLTPYERVADRWAFQPAAMTTRPPLARAWLHHVKLAEFRIPPGPARERPELEACGIPAAANAAPAMLTHPVVPEAVCRQEQPPAPRHPGCAGTERVPVRVHVDPPAGHGVTVWLGIDGAGALATPQGAAAVADLRRALLGRQERITQVVCNGMALFPMRKETS